jgi:hypothetical protein
MEREGRVTFDPKDGGDEVTITSEMAEVSRRWTFQGRRVNHISVDSVVVVLED